MLALYAEYYIRTVKGYLCIVTAHCTLLYANMRAHVQFHNVIMLMHNAVD